MKEDALLQIFGGTLPPPSAGAPVEERPPVQTAVGEPFPQTLGGADRLAELPISSLADYPLDLFHPYTGDELEKLRLNIAQRGLIHPIVVRPLSGVAYQIISGHNRRTACQLAGYVTVPCIIRQLDDDTALLQYLDANVNERSALLPSEKAKAFRMRLELMNRQGKRTDLTSPNTTAKFSRSDDELGALYGISGDTVRLYIQLASLIPLFLHLVDEKQLPVTVAAALSHLSTENQAAVHQFCIADNNYPITQHIVDLLRANGDDAPLTPEALQAIFTPVVKPLRSIPVPMKKLQAYIPSDTTKAEIERIIIEAVKYYYSSKKDKET